MQGIFNRAAHRLCVGVMNFRGVRFGFEVGVEACWVFLLLLGVFGSSASLVGSHYRFEPVLYDSFLKGLTSSRGT